MVFLPSTAVMSAEEAANVIKVDECDRYDEEWTPPFDARDSVLLKTNEKFTDWYDLYDCLGEGKFGKVYRCLEKSTKLELAAKCIRLKRDADKKQVEKEISFMTRMRHKCIAQIYDAFALSSNEVVLIMELVHGGELFDRVVEENYILTETAVAMIVYQICEAIRYIHSHNIIHLDLKPENIMCVTETGNQIKLIDFGLAQYYDGEHDLLFMAGTPEFAAPEVIKFEPLDFHTDMWSVGVIVYILLSGESPFLGDNLALTYFNVERGLWEFCEEFDDNGVSDDARDFIKKLLILDKSKRMLPDDCLQHPWILYHRERARKNRQDESSKIDTTKLRSYVRNKKFRRAVFGVLFVNSIVRLFKTLKEKKSETGIEYVKNMINAVNEQNENGEGSSTETSIFKKAINMKRKKNADTDADIPGPSTTTTTLSTDELEAKAQRLDSGLGEGSTKVSAVEGPEEPPPVMIHIPINETETAKPSREPSPIPEESKNSLNVLDSKSLEKLTSESDEEKGGAKKIKKKKTTSAKISHDSALSPGLVSPVINKNSAAPPPSSSVIMSTATTTIETISPKNVININNNELTVTSSSVPSSAAVTTTTATSEEEGAPKPKKIVRKKKIVKPVLTLRDVEVPVMKSKKPKKKSIETILDSPTPKGSSLESDKKLRNSDIKDEQQTMENPETQPIQTLIGRRRGSADKRGGLVGNLLGKFEQNLDPKPPMKFAVSGVVPVKKVVLPTGLPRPPQKSNPSPQWTSATDVVKVNGLPAKIEKIPNETTKIENVTTKTEIPMELERKIVSEKRTSIRKKNLKEEQSMADDTITESKKSNTDSYEVGIHSTTKIQEGAEKLSKTSSKALYLNEVKMVEKEKSENKTPEVLQLLAEKKITSIEKLGLNQINSENGVKVLERSLKLKEEENAKALISIKSVKDENVGGAMVIESKKIFEAKIGNDGKVESTKVERKQKITSKPPKPMNDFENVKLRKTKNKSFDDLLNDSNNEEKKKSSNNNVTLLRKKEEIPKHHDVGGRSGSVQPRPPHKTQSAMNVNESTTFAYNNKNNNNAAFIQSHHFKNGETSKSSNRYSIELTPEEIDEIQAKERDAYDFGNLKAQLERRVSGDRPVNEYDEWRKAKAEDIRSSLHDSTNIKRAMKKWISMDKANRSGGE
uniref:Protein kinase domain-containing protein n=1 Tax=Panagrolaimus sp. ES5 TaxID=591445 RepID=A0AC34FDB3_9BILA